MDVVAAVDGQKIHDRQATLSEGRSGKGDGVAQGEWAAGIGGGGVG
jgi:hypothetical protein